MHVFLMTKPRIQGFFFFVDIEDSGQPADFNLPYISLGTFSHVKALSFFSSPETKAQDELLRSLAMSHPSIHSYE